MSDDLHDKLDSAIGKMADLVKAQPDSQKSLHCSQAALNLAHTKSILSGVKPAKVKRTEETEKAD